MSAPQQLTDAQRARLLTGHHIFKRREMVRYWLLSEADIQCVNNRRRRHNRLGFAVQLCLLRYPGWPLKPEEFAPQNLLEYVGRQLAVDPIEIAEYPRRDRTRREHVQELSRLYRFRHYQTPFPAMLREQLRQKALSTDSAFTLVEAAMEWLREQRVVPPALTTLESLVRSIRSEVERETYQRMAESLGVEQNKMLDNLLDFGPSRGSLLGWLRRVPRSCSATGILDLIQRVQWIREQGLPEELSEAIPTARLRQLAARGARHSVAHYRRFPDQKRRAILAAFLLDVAKDLTDRSMDFHKRLIGRMFNRSEKKRWAEFVDSDRQVNEKLHNYLRLSRVIMLARKEGSDVGQAIEKVISWETLARDAEEVERLAKPLDSSNFDHFRAHFPQFRQYTPKFLETFQFEAIPTLKPLMNALDVLRNMNRDSQTELPISAPRSFVRLKWSPFVFTDKGLDRGYYELCALSELSLGLRSGDIWVRGSRRYKNLESYLMAPAVWAQKKSQLLKNAEPALDCESYLVERKRLLNSELTAVAELTRNGQLPEARLEGNRLVISPLTRLGPDQAEHWAEKVYDILPRIDLTQLLLEVDSWTHFSNAFSHLYTGQPTPDTNGLLTAILADATGLGKTKMADATRGYTADRLDWIEDWYIRDTTYTRALAEIVRLQSRIPLASQWGSGRTSSSDGQAFPIAFRKPVIAQVNAKYGRDPVAMFYTHVSDRYAPFHVQAISSTVRDATHVLDGLLDQETDTQIEEHYTDTAGYTDHIFAISHLLGFRFAPRIRDLGDHRVYCMERPSHYEALKPLIGGRIRQRTIREHWDEVARLIASLRHGTASASLLVSKLAGYPRQSHLAVTLREIGRIERSLFTLAWLQDPELRRRVTAGLNKGEAHHSLKRAVRFYRRGAVSDRTQLDQDISAMALNLVVAAIIVWNTAYLDTAIKSLQEQGAPVPESFLPHISPLGWEHITLTGTYQWNRVETSWGKFRPLRRHGQERTASQVA